MCKYAQRRKSGENTKNMSTVRPRSFRLVCPPARVPQVESLLTAQGFIFEEEAFSPFCRRLLHEPLPLGSSLAATFGLLYIQDRSSMLPPLALNPQQGSTVVDMCASPGSKTGFLAQLTGNTGFVLGNEPGRPRLSTLRANLQTLQMLHAATCSYAGENLPLCAGLWDNIQLDPPCSGWGTVEKNPQVMDLWKGDKVKPLITLQRQLLAKAAQLLRPGGRVVYSTCTTNQAENEDQIRYAVEELGLCVQPLPPFAGFVWEEAQPHAAGTLRVDGEKSGAQGFYIACLTKPLSAQSPLAAEARSEPTMQTPAPLFHLAAHQRLDKSMLQGTFVDPDLLPPGQVAVFGDTVRFIPQAALGCLPDKITWQGANIGKLAGGRVHVSPRLRVLLPETIPAQALELDDVDSILRLLTGQSLQTGISGTETALYWRGLPLTRLKLKNGRALWTNK